MPDDQETLVLIKKAHDLLGYNQSNEFLTNIQKSPSFEKANQVKAALILRNAMAQLSGRAYLSTSIDGSPAHYSSEGAGPEGGLPLLKKFGYQPGPIVEAMKIDVSKVKDFEWSEMHMESIRSIVEDPGLLHAMHVGGALSSVSFQAVSEALNKIRAEVASWHGAYAKTVKTVEAPAASKAKAKKP